MSIRKKQTVGHTQQTIEWQCWTYLADAMRLALWEASSKSHWIIRTLLQCPVFLFPFSAVMKFLKESMYLIFRLRSYFKIIQVTTAVWNICLLLLAVEQTMAAETHCRLQKPSAYNQDYNSKVHPSEKQYYVKQMIPLSLLRGRKSASYLLSIPLQLNHICFTEHTIYPRNQTKTIFCRFHNI